MPRTRRVLLDAALRLDQAPDVDGALLAKEIFAALAVLATSKDIAQSNGLQRFQVMRGTPTRAAEERTPREPPGQIDLDGRSNRRTAEIPEFPPGFASVRHAIALRFVNWHGALCFYS